MPLCPTKEELKKSEAVCENFATPLMGTFLNLTKEPALIQCPSCGIRDLTDVQHEIRGWVHTVNCLYVTLFMCFCCRWCFDVSAASKKSDANHYCKHCACFLGRAKRVRPLLYEKGKRINNLYPPTDVY